ncbi:MAG: DUF4294 domain-containing protein [Prevotellaceae bacterium]|jgi:hypothetical protein|nr:DUF4294 domain-containing protein [Prevotellaceae bacterium]
MKQKRHILIALLALTALTGRQATAQRVYTMPPTVENGDTLYQLVLPPVFVFAVSKSNAKDWREYRRLVYNFRKVYPYALLAKQKTEMMEAELAQLSSKKDRDALIARYEKELFAEFEKPLRKLTFSQGKLLLKLIDREVGQTSYYLIKDLKGGLTAFFWQGIAKFFGANLKKPYDKYGEDRDIEKLVKLYQEGSFDWLYFQLFGVTVSDARLSNP